MKEGQAPQEPPAQRVGENIIEAESGANADGIHHTNTDGVAYTNPDGATHANTDDAEQPEESNDSSGTFNWDDFEPDAGTIKLDLDKIHGIPGSSKQSVPESTAEMLRKC